MKQIFRKFLWVALLCLPSFFAGGQTADEYVRPYAEPFQYGANVGYYGQAWTDDGLAGILQQVGGHSLRPTLPEWFVENYGYDIRLNTFNAYTTTFGMKEITCFIEAPSEAHRDKTVYDGSGTQQSKLFANLYQPIWNADGTVNATNYYAIYVYKLLLTYGSKVRFWEVVNEPDYGSGASAAEWLTRAPTPAEQLNTLSPFYHYIRMLRITYEVVKKYRPEAYVTTGGLGYPEYVDALLRYTDNPNGGAVTAQYPRAGGAYFDVLSFHAYPNYALHYWDNALNGFRYTRTSDYAANRVIEYKNSMAAVLNKYGYNGTAHPNKLFVLTESNVSRRTSGDRTGSDESQRNFAIKALVLNQKADIKQFYYYATGETVDAPAAGQSVSGSDEIGLMGLYENLKRDAPGSAKPVPAGRAFATTSQLLYGYQYDAARTAALNLPSSVDGGAFGKNGQYVYVLWAKALVDDSEQASATYSFPAALSLSSVQRYEWDYSVSGAKTTQAAQGIALSGSPSFFVGAATAPVVVTPPPTTTPPTTACVGTGSLLREQWSNVSGPNLADIPLASAPSTSAALTQFEAADQYGFNYGARLRGYLCVPQSGAYTFWVAGDDQAELYLSTTDQPANAQRIASCATWTSSVHDFTRSPSQQSAPVQLVAGQRYYIEARHKQAWGPGYLSVAWLRPDGTRQEPIPGSALIPFDGTAAAPAPTAPIPTTPTPTTPPTTACVGTGSLLREQWSNVSGPNLADIPLASAPSTSAPLTKFEAADQYGFNYGARLRGYLCVPQSGAYTFWVAGDDQAELYLSTTDQPANAQRIAYCATWTANAHEYYRSPSQQSAPVQLVAGQRYYIEARHKQAWGPGYLSVAWRLPNGTTEDPIPGSRLSPFGAAASITATGQTALVATGGAANVSSTATELLAYPNPFTQQTTVEFSLVAAGPARLAVYDVQGRLVRQLFAGQGQAGASQRFTLEAQGLSAGVYVLRLVTDKNVLTQKLVLSR